MIAGINNRANGINIYDPMQRSGRAQNQDKSVNDAEKLRNKDIENEDKKGGSIREKIVRLKADEYVHGEEPVSAGAYHIAQDDEGNPKISFDNPEMKAAAKPESKPADSKPEKSDEDNPKKASDSDPKEETKSTRCTVDTDKVDREIEKLKKKQAELEQQLAGAQDNPQEAEKLQKQLEQVNQELEMKDNDTYRRQHSQYRNG